MLRDTLNRPIKDLRISVTDRCNYRCTYCMPLEQYVWIKREEILTYEEVTRLARLFIEMGVEKIRLTGGEPLLRKDLGHLIAQLSPLAGLKDLCLTTNASALSEKAAELKAAGLKRINVSLDTLNPETFRKMAQRDDLSNVLEGLATAKRAGLAPIKLNSVIERGINDGEILALVEYARSNGFAIRFIEYMDVGNANQWESEKMVSKKEILDTIAARYPLKQIGRMDGNAPSVDYEFVDAGGELGVIASVTEPFCSDCTRARLTADGKLVTCLFASTGHDLKGPLRNGAGDDELKRIITGVWNGRADRYSDERYKAMHTSGYQPRKKIEMITLGG